MMKFLVLALFVAAAYASPIPEENGEPVELIVNGVPEGTPLELGDVVEIKLKEHVDGQLASSTNLLHPFTAVGIAEAAAAAEAAADADEPSFQVVPEGIVIPELVSPEVAPSPVVLPEPVLPEIAPSPVVLPEPTLPEVVPSPIILPEPTEPEGGTPVIPTPILPEPEITEPIPEPGPQIPTGEVFNNGLVQVHVNAPEDAGVFATIQNWLSLVINYFNNGVQTSEQIV